MSYEQEHQVTPGQERRRRIIEIERLWANSLGNDPLDPTLISPELQQAFQNLQERFGDARNGTGMPQTFIDSLDRAEKKDLQSDECAICSVPYLDDDFPLVVVLPCPGKHRFDLDCIAPWLKGNSTCPMCRHDFLAKKEVIVDDEEEDYDDMYA